jgi:hypothetical protein
MAALAGSIFMLIANNCDPLIGLFFPMMFCYFGLSLIFANASTTAMSNVADKAHASAVLNFTNMGFATVVVLGVSMLSVTTLILPTIFIAICIFMLCLNRLAVKQGET